MINKLLKNIPLNRVNWITSSFLMGTLFIALTALPWYIYNYGLDSFQVTLFFIFYFSTGLSITLGYHRLFSHLAFKARFPVKLFVLIFGAAAFENSALDWCSDHRRHHKHVDTDDDPYDITKGFWFAHIGWLLFKLNPEPSMDNVADLRKDSLVMWQYRWITPLSLFAGFALPAILGYLYGGFSSALGAFFIAGVARIVTVQQSTFFINSLCHLIGSRPYSSKCSARDSWIAAIPTFGEGYHNFHHEFQHDYRNGVKPWQFDPTKWTIWTLSKLGLASNLRRVPESKILLAEMKEAQRQVDSKLTNWLPELTDWANQLSDSKRHLMEDLLVKMNAFSDKFNETTATFQSITNDKIELSKDAINQWRKEIHAELEHLDSLISQTLALKSSLSG